MNCHEFEAILPDVAGSGRVDASTRERGLAHAANCASCGARFSEEWMLSAALRALAASTENVQAPERLEARLRHEFRTRPVAAASGGSVRRPGWALAAAAAIVVLAAATVVNLGGPAKAPQAAPLPRLRLFAVARPEPVGEAGRITTSFLPVPYGALGPAEGGELIRVRLPRTVLLSFGLPMNAELAAEPVEAEVLYGEGGVAKAIRFVK